MPTTSTITSVMGYCCVCGETLTEMLFDANGGPYCSMCWPFRAMVASMVPVENIQKHGNRSALDMHFWDTRKSVKETARCPKCLAKKPNIKFLAGHETKVARVLDTLQITCVDCGFSWTTLALDQGVSVGFKEDVSISGATSHYKPQKETPP